MTLKPFGRLMTGMETLFVYIMSGTFILQYILVISGARPTIPGLAGLFCLAIAILAGCHWALKRTSPPVRPIYATLAVLGAALVYVRMKDMYYVFPDGTRFFRYNKMVATAIVAVSPMFFVYLATRARESGPVNFEVEKRTDD